MDPGIEETVQFVAPAAGSYTFVCTVHLGMTGELRVIARAAMSGASGTRVARS